jgi:hypothetical protein
MSDALTCLEMGNVFQRVGNQPAAADAYQHAINTSPTYARSYYCQANIERELGKQKVITEFHKLSPFKIPS